MNRIQSISDAQLVQISVGGDRAALEEIVRRNLSPVAAVAYALTGNAATSEDVTQEVFLTAWQRLKDLREPEKLRSWLCAIARNVANAFGRKRIHDPLHSPDGLEITEAVASQTPSPVDTAIDAEQQRLVWSAIEQIPESYRVPLVLFYRESQSTAQVAKALELTEEAVRQRLSRARSMLKEEVGRMVETTISSTRPNVLLTTAIMAGIAGTALHASAAATTAAAAAKLSAGGAATTGVALSGAVIGSVLGPVVGIAGAVAGCMASLRRAKTPEERQLVIRSIWHMLALVTGWFVVLGLVILSGVRGWLTPVQSLITGSFAILLYIALLLKAVLDYNRQAAVLMLKRPGYVQLTPLERHLNYVKSIPTSGRWNILGAHAGSVYGSLAWILVEASLRREPAIFFATAVFGTIAMAVGVKCSIRKPQNYLYYMAMQLLAIVGAYIAAALYWHLNGVQTLLGEFPASPLVPAIIACAMIPVAFVILHRHRKYTRMSKVS